MSAIRGQKLEGGSQMSAVSFQQSAVRSQQSAVYYLFELMGILGLLYPITILLLSFYYPITILLLSDDLV
jgi:fumarate reductase subunit D